MSAMTYRLKHDLKQKCKDHMQHQKCKDHMQPFKVYDTHSSLSCPVLYLCPSHRCCNGKIQAKGLPIECVTKSRKLWPWYEITIWWLMCIVYVLQWKLQFKRLSASGIPWYVLCRSHSCWFLLSLNKELNAWSSMLKESFSSWWVQTTHGYFSTLCNREQRVNTLFPWDFVLHWKKKKVLSDDKGMTCGWRWLWVEIWQKGWGGGWLQSCQEEGGNPCGKTKHRARDTAGNLVRGHSQ